MKALSKAKVARVVGGAPVAYLAVETASGPHVTPLLFAATPDRLWFGIGRGTLKARALAKRPAVGVVVPGTQASVAVRGEATLLDRLPPAPAELARAPFALPAFATQNALEVAAFARDVAWRGGRRQTLAPLSVTVETLDLLEGWSAEAVLGWMAAEGPIALPARWDERTARARVPATPLRRAGGARSSTASLCIDESEGPGPLAKRGRLLRGRGRATLRGETASVALDVERITRWKGFEVRTAAAEAAETPGGRSR
jgi:nitroimidazol reductase NimA-like FMN-containing flavoprotein (pyridoxamine 5'-phosphate oxidase superfamily)